MTASATSASGPPSAKRVLILVPGTQGGAGDFSLVGPEIVRRVPGLQVWAYERRSQAFEDHTGFATGDPDRAFGYYLGGQAIGSRRFAPVAGATVPFVREWGLKLALEDLRRVVRRARRGGREVILGGHSLGASMALAYAAWDFGGRAGHRDLSGLVLIDGGLLGIVAAAARRRPAATGRAAQRRPVPRPPRHRRAVGLGRAERRPAGLYTRLRPDARATLTDFAAAAAVAARAVPGHQRGGARLRVRPHDLARRARADPGARRPRRADRRPAAVAGRRGDADPEPRAAVRPLAGRRRRVVLPGPALARRRRARARSAATPSRGCSACACSHRRTIRLPLYALQTDLARRARAARRAAADRRLADPGAAREARRRLARRTATSTRSPPAPARSRFLKTVVPFLRRPPMKLLIGGELVEGDGRPRWRSRSPRAARSSPPSRCPPRSRSTRRSAPRARRVARLGGDAVGRAGGAAARGRDAHPRARPTRSPRR